MIFTLALAQVDTAWVRRWDGAAHLLEWTTALALDSSSNVIVTGNTETDTILGHEDIITLKYSPTGELLWARQYGTPNELDRSCAVACDRQGNVYVTGELDRARHMVVLKYDSMGTLKWVRQYGNYGADLGLDCAGNIYVCGDTYQNQTLFDFITIKYRPNGDTAWVRKKDGARHEDYPVDIAVDSKGRVCVVGECWYSVGVDYLTVVYDSLGFELWSAVYDSTPDIDMPSAVAVDSFGNVIVTGTSKGDSADLDYLTIKYSPDGKTCWRQRFNGTANLDEGASAMAIDKDGNIYVTGGAAMAGTGSDYVTIKYGPQGNQLWVARYDGPAHRHDVAFALGLDESGYVYVTGSSWGFGRDEDCVTICYPPDGRTAWVHRFDTLYNGVIEAYFLAVGPNREVVVAGVVYDTLINPIKRDILIIKYVQPGGIDGKGTEPAQRLVLFAEPNPFQDQTTVRFSAVSGVVRVEVYDVTGRLVKRLTPMDTGLFRWNRIGEDNKRLPAGVYTLIIATRNQQAAVKLIALP